MKRFIQFGIALLSLLPLGASAQVIGSVGIKAGITLANQSFRYTPIDYTLETDLLTGVNSLIFLELFRSEHVSMQMDLGYVGKGSRTSTTSVTVNHLENDRITVNEGEEVASTFHYFSLSPLARFRAQKGALTPYLLLGPRLDLLLGYQTDSPYPLGDQSELLVGLTGGLGFEYSVGRAGLFAEFQYQPDLSPVTNQEPLLVNNNALLATVGIRFAGL